MPMLVLILWYVLWSKKRKSQGEIWEKVKKGKMGRNYTERVVGRDWRKL